MKAEECVDYFEELYKLSLSSFKKLQPEWENITADLLHISRIFHLRGYMKEKSRVMDLLFRINESHPNDTTFINISSFVLERIQSSQNKDVAIIQKILPALETVLWEKYSKLKTLSSPRTEVVVCLCILNLAYYYFLQDKKENCFLLLELVRDFIDLHRPEPDGKSGLTRMYYHIIRLRIRRKLNNHSKKATSEIENEVKAIYDCFRNHTYISSLDSILYPTIQYDIINELFSYHLLSFTTDQMTPYIRLLLSSGFINGCILRIIQMISIYSYVHYQSENMAKFMVIL